MRAHILEDAHPDPQLTPRSFVARSGPYIPENRILQRFQDSHHWSHVFQYQNDVDALQDEGKKKELHKQADDVMLKAKAQVLAVFPLLAALDMIENVPKFLNVARVVRVFSRLLVSLSPLSKTHIRNHGEYLPNEPGLIATRTEEYERHDQRPV